MKIRILIALILLTGLVTAQSNRQFIGLSVGPAFPNGEFSKADINDSTSGWAKTGVAINVAYGYRFTHNLGVYVTGLFSSNRFDNIGYKNVLEEMHPELNISVESTRNWSCGGLLVGPFLRLPLSGNLDWTIRGAFGFYAVYSPKITIYATPKDPPSEKATYYRESGNAVSYAYSFGTGFKYKLSKYYILLFADYLNSPVKIKNASGWDFNDDPYMISFHQNISYIAVTLGFGYYF